MINILHVVSGTTEAGGVEEMVSLLCKYIDSSSFTHSIWAPFGAGDYLERNRSEGFVHSCSVTTQPDELVKYFNDSKIDIALVHSGALNPLFACHQIGALHSFENLPLVEILHRAIPTWAGPYGAKKIIAISDFVASLQSWPFSQRVERISNGIDLQPYQSFDQEQSACRRTLGIPEDGFIVGFLGRMTDEKGAMDILKAAPVISSSIGDVCFVFGGDGPQRQLLEEKARQLGVNALFPGVIGQEQKVGFLRSLDLLVLTSRTEAFCLVALESMSAGTPLVAYALEPLKEFFLEQEDTYFLVPPGDVGSLADAVIRMFIDDGMRKKIAELCLEISRKYSIQRVAREYERVLLAVSRSQNTPPVWEIRPPLYRSLGSICLVMNKRDCAQKYFHEAVRLDPRLAGVIAHDIAQYNECIKKFMEELNDQPEER